VAQSLPSARCPLPAARCQPTTAGFSSLPSAHS